MTVVVEGKSGFYFGSRAHILTPDYETAWAEKHVIHNPAHSWIIGKFVEADRANNNRQYFSLEGLRMAQPTIAHSPMNIDHIPRKIVGAYVATDMLYPTAEGAASVNPYIEALGVFWKAHFPEEWAKVKEAHDMGHLFFSMECVPKQIGCIGDGGCGQVFQYAGVQSDSYCEHINNRTSDKDLIEPHFTAGAILLPPVRPGWSDAEIHSLVARHAEVAEQTYTTVAEEMDNLSPMQWEGLMAQLLSLAEKGRDFSPEERQRLAKMNHSLPDGSFPISNVSDLKNAIQAFGRAGNKAAAKAHIMKRACALSAEDLIPDEWHS